MVAWRPLAVNCSEKRDMVVYHIAKVYPWPTSKGNTRTIVGIMTYPKKRRAAASMQVYMVEENPRLQSLVYDTF